MVSPNTCPGEGCSTVGVDAIALDVFADVETMDGETIIYDEENEDAWIQSDCYHSLETIV